MDPQVRVDDSVARIFTHSGASHVVASACDSVSRRTSSGIAHNRNPETGKRFADHVDTGGEIGEIAGIYVPVEPDTLEPEVVARAGQADLACPVRSLFGSGEYSVWRRLASLAEKFHEFRNGWTPG
jgi:hypothetical protein